jgi:putative NADPH-quinone reductase
MAKILVLCGHPRAESYCAALAKAYATAATDGGHQVVQVAIADPPITLTPPDYKDFKTSGVAPEWVATAQAQIAACDHWVIVAPLWWGGMPAVLKAYLDAVLLPGFAFRYHAKGLGWDKLLKGRSARVIITADTPPFIFRWFWGRPLVKQWKIQILGFCGFSPVKSSFLGSIKTSTPEKRQKWLAEIADLGRAGA